MNIQLYQLADEYQHIQSRLSDADIDEQVINDTLEALQGDLQAKATNVAMVIRNWQASAEAMKNAEAEIAKRRKHLEKRSESLIEYLKTNMQRCGISKIESPYFALTIKKNPPSVVIDDANAIPSDYMVQPETPPPAPDKKLIAQAIKDGYEVPGAHLAQGERLEIK